MVGKTGRAAEIAQEEGGKTAGVAGQEPGWERAGRARVGAVCSLPGPSVSHSC